MSSRLRFGRYDYAAFCSFSAYAISSLAIPIVLVAMAKELGFPLDHGGMGSGGAIHLVRSIAMCVTLFLCAFAAAKWGNRRVVGFAVVLFGSAIFLCSRATGFAMVMPLVLVAGLGEGLIEGIGTPFVQDLHKEEPSRYVNFAHGFWSLGILVAVPLLGALLFWGMSWRNVLVVSSLFCIPSLLLLFLPEHRHPYPEKATAPSSSEVTNNAVAIFRRPRFWSYFAAMFLAGGGEYCLTFWCASFIQLNFSGSALAGGIGTAAFSLGMFLGRTGVGAFVHQHQLKRALVAFGVSATLISLLIPPFALHYDFLPHGAVLPVLYVLLFISGLGTAPFWPSIQSFAADRMPQLDSTMIFVILSCAGTPGAGFFTWLMGFTGDLVGLPLSFLLVPACFASMTAFILLPDFFRAHRRSIL